MNRPSKKEIAERVAKLKPVMEAPTASPDMNAGKPTPKKSSQRIRKQGV